MPIRRASILLAALAFALPAWATEFCMVRKTADGYVALRADPSTKAKILARMRVGDEVRLLDETSGGFRRAVHYVGDSRLTKGFGSGREGWVNPRLVGDCG